MPQALVTLPDGRKARVTFDTPDQPDAAVNDLTSKQPVGTMTDIATEPAKAFLSGTAASAMGGLAGLANMATNAVGLTKTDPADTVRSFQDKYTYQPRTKVGQNATQALSFIPEKIAQGADWVGEKVAGLTGSPLAGAAVNTGIQALPMLGVPEALKGKAPASGWPARQVPAEQVPAAKARSLGLKLPPDAEAQPVGSAVASLMGRAQFERDLAVKNAPKVNEAVNADLGIKGDRVDLAAMARKRNAANSVYAEASALPDGQFSPDFKAAVSAIDDRTGAGTFPADTPAKVQQYKADYGSLDTFKSADVVNKIKALRADGFKNQGKIRSPEENAIGYAQLRLADALQSELERHAASVGQPDLVPRLVDARTQLAKLNTARRAIQGDNFSARKLSSMAGKNEPLSGNARTLADVYDSFDRALQDRNKIRNNGPFSVVDGQLSLWALASNPKLAGMALARPFARGLLGSDLYQNPTFGPVRGPVNPSAAPNLLLGAQPPIAGLLAPQWQQQ